MFKEIEILRSKGFSPKTIIDVGAHIGDWTRRVSSIFPCATFYLVEPDPANAFALNTLTNELRGRAIYLPALVGEAYRPSVNFYMMGSGSSVLPEKTTFPRMRQTFPMTTIDSLLAPFRVLPPVFLKLDVQGYELAVLQGATTLLEDTSVILSEASLLEYNQGAPLVADLIAWLVGHSFVPYDFCGGLRRQSDGTLFQIDVMFVQKDHHLRAPARFWLNEP